jgi:DNA-binding HxlR family transcriptional regulator
MARTNLYPHFCPIARALEVVGEKWSLLIVRDLLAGPQRFTDLERSVAGITPKWLAARLRELTQAGIVVRVPVDGGREARYALTERGRELAPVVGALALWGFHHAMRPPLDGEQVSPWRLVFAFRGYLQQTAAPVGPVSWRLIFDGERRYLLRWEGTSWRAGRDDPAVDVQLSVHTTTDAWVEMLTGARPPAEAVTADGSPREAALLAAVLEGLRARRDGQLEPGAAH